MSSSYRDRVLALYEAYDPTKAAKVDGLLEKYDGREDELIAALVEKYGAEPAAASPPQTQAAPAKPAAAVVSYHARVMAIYQKYDPGKVNDAGVNAMLKKFQGQEDDLIESLVAKYGPEPTQGEVDPTSAPPAQPDAPSAPAPIKRKSLPSTHRDRIVALYRKYDPEKLSKVDLLLEKYAGREEELIDALVGRYGPEEGRGSPLDEPSMRSGHPVEHPAVSRRLANPLSGYRERIVAMYEKYDSAKAPTVDTLLAKYQGREEELLEALVSKYGPEPAASAGSAADGVPVVATARRALPDPMEGLTESERNRMHALMMSEGVTVDNLAGIRVLRKLVSLETMVTTLDTKTFHYAVDSEATVRLIQEEDAERIRIDDLDDDERSILSAKFHQAMATLLVRSRLQCLQQSQVRASSSYYYKKWMKFVGWAKLQRLQDRVARMSTYDKLLLTRSAKNYYERLDRQEKARVRQQTEKLQRASLERERKLEAAYRRGDFIQQNIQSVATAFYRPSLKAERATPSPSKKTKRALAMPDVSSPLPRIRSTSPLEEGQPPWKITKASDLSARPAAQLLVQYRPASSRRKSKKDNLGRRFAVLSPEMQCSVLRHLRDLNIPADFVFPETLLHDSAFSEATLSRQRRIIEESHADAMFASAMVDAQNQGNAADDSEAYMNADEREALECYLAQTLEDMMRVEDAEPHATDTDHPAAEELAVEGHPSMAAAEAPPAAKKTPEVDAAAPEKLEALHGAQQDPVHPAAGEVSGDWKAVKDEKSGRMYFLNTATKKTTWNISETSFGKAGSVHAAPSAKPEVHAPAPGEVKGDWRAMKDEKSGRTYFINTATKSTTWNISETSFGAAAPAPSGVSSVASPAAGEVRGDWKAVKDEKSGRMYFLNTATKKTTWNISETSFANAR